MPFDLDSLRWFARRNDPLAALDQAWASPSWPTGQAALEQTLGMDDGHHFLRHHRGLLPQLWETQITRALQAMLVAVPERTLERCQALLRALRGPSAPDLVKVERITADAKDRMDLAIHGKTAGDSPCCIVIEAKLDSPLSKTQLANYLRVVAPAYPHPRQRHLWVVAPARTTKTATTLQQRENQEWQFVTWRRLLIEWQRALPPDPGSDVLSLFGEIWKRVGGS